MKSNLTKFALTATLGLAITLTLNACEEKEKKKQDGTDTKPSGTVTCSCGKEECEKEGPKTIEAVFLENDDSDSEGLAYSKFRLANGSEITLNGFAPDDVKKGDKVSVTYKVMESTTFGEGDVMVCAEFKTIISVKKIGGSATTLTDPRDSKTYKTVKIGNQTWMAENLNYDNWWCYGSDYDEVVFDVKTQTEKRARLSKAEVQANCDKYGRLYEWETAKSICPQGWHLPSDKEWEILVNFVGGSNQAAKKLKTSYGWKDNDNGSDAFGFSALPGGEVNLEYDDDSYHKIFQGVGVVGCWWGASENEHKRARLVEDFNYDVDGNHYNYPPGGGCSVRCLQN